MIYVLDRVEGDTAVFVADSGATLELPAADFADRRGGDVFCESDGVLTFDEAATGLRRTQMRERFRRLLHRNGSDLKGE